MRPCTTIFHAVARFFIPSKHLDPFRPLLRPSRRRHSSCLECLTPLTGLGAGHENLIKQLGRPCEECEGGMISAGPASWAWGRVGSGGLDALRPGNMVYAFATQYVAARSSRWNVCFISSA